jgi:hypothetical protein
MVYMRRSVLAPYIMAVVAFGVAGCPRSKDASDRVEYPWISRIGKAECSWQAEANAMVVVRYDTRAWVRNGRTYDNVTSRIAKANAGKDCDNLLSYSNIRYQLFGPRKQVLGALASMCRMINDVGSPELLQKYYWDAQVKDDVVLAAIMDDGEIESYKHVRERWPEYLWASVLVTTIPSSRFFEYETIIRARIAGLRPGTRDLATGFWRRTHVPKDLRNSAETRLQRICGQHKVMVQSAIRPDETPSHVKRASSIREVTILSPLSPLAVREVGRYETRWWHPKIGCVGVLLPRLATMMEGNGVPVSMLFLAEKAFVILPDGGIEDISTHPGTMGQQLVGLGTCAHLLARRARDSTDAPASQLRALRLRPRKTLRRRRQPVGRCDGR